MDSTYWRKSSYSGGQGGNCVEVGSCPTFTPGGSSGGNRAGAGDQDGVVLVRDTQDRDGGALAFGPAAWRAFTKTLG